MPWSVFVFEEEESNTIIFKERRNAIVGAYPIKRENTEMFSMLSRLIEVIM